MKDLISFIAKSLVDNPTSVSVSEDVDGDTHVYTLKVGEGETGRVIGKHGRTARAMRILLNAAAMKNKIKANLEIQD